MESITPPVLSCHPPKYSPFGAICEKHVDETVSLWALWQTALTQPIYDKNSLGVIENKIQANIAGMMVNPDEAWSYCICTFTMSQPAEIFSMTQLAFRSYKSARIRSVMELVEKKTELAQGLVSALAWFPKDIAHPWLTKFLKSRNLDHKAIALRACRLRNEMPSKYLTRFLEKKCYNNHKQLYLQSLRIVGELKIHAQKPFLLLALHGSDRIRFWALYSLVLLGEHHFAKDLSPYIFKNNNLQAKAIDLAFRVLPIPEAWDLIYELREYPQFKRQTIRATAALADPTSIPWILEQMKNPALARICGEVFHHITGIDLEASDLSLDAPCTTTEISKLENELIPKELLEDEHLPWPDTTKVTLYWQYTNQSSYKDEQRTFFGLPHNKHQLKIALNKGRQRQRRSAAIELALRDPKSPLFNICGACTQER